MWASFLIMPVLPKMCIRDRCTSLKEIYIPKNVVSIDIEAFSGCKNLQKIEVAEDNEYYSSENNILYDKEKTIVLCCPAGKGTVVIPDGVKKIEKRAFSYCDKITSLALPDSVEEIGEEAFFGCKSCLLYTSRCV